MTFDWVKAQQDQPVPTLEHGESGYLAAPASSLDPHLFTDNKKLMPRVRYLITEPLKKYLKVVKLKGVDKWLRVWLAGSGITYQWAAGRGNGDLDVLIGIDRVGFNQDNPDYAEMGEDDIANALNTALRDNLWPRTSAMDINGKTFEVTYYYNSGTGTDITRIHPYAAYDVLNYKWVVEPPDLPEHPAQLFPQTWFNRANADTDRAEDYVRRYRRAYEVLTGHKDEAARHNAGALLNMVTSQAQALLTDIHHGRTEAFQGGGKGYTDWANFRWQRAKHSGTVKALSEISGVRERAAEDQQQELYGGKLAGAEELVRRAVQQHRDIL
jgi:hypothetical protein